MTAFVVCEIETGALVTDAVTALISLGSTILRYDVCTGNSV